MAMCTVADVRAIVDPKTLTDNDITSIINFASDGVAEDTGAGTSSSDSKLKKACIHTAAALVLQKMKFTGELANQVQYGSNSQSNNVNADIAMHRELAAQYIQKYNASSGFSIVYGRVGIGTVNEGD